LGGELDDLGGDPIQGGPIPRLVTEGVPSRMPEGLNGLRGS
jgi:hypothetical protein